MIDRGVVTEARWWWTPPALLMPDHLGSTPGRASSFIHGGRTVLRAAYNRSPRSGPERGSTPRPWSIVWEGDKTWSSLVLKATPQGCLDGAEGWASC